MKGISHRARTNVNTVEAKNRFNELVAGVNQTKEPVVIKKRGKPVAVVLDYESFEEQGKASGSRADKGLFADLQAFHRLMRNKYPEGTGDAVEIIRRARLERSR